jgi:hypothetical protein
MTATDQTDTRRRDVAVALDLSAFNNMPYVLWEGGQFGGGTGICDLPFFAKHCTALQAVALISGNSIHPIAILERARNP